MEQKARAARAGAIGAAGSLGRLKSFFSPQLAESIINGGGEDLLKTHRREVVVAFLDMRGFTAFTDRSEPEEVMGVLADYHRVMGQLIVAHEGTLECFAGDGMMIFFNDPIPLANPTANAVRMALAMQQQFVPLRGDVGKGAVTILTLALALRRATRRSARSVSRGAGTTPASAASPTLPRVFAAKPRADRSSPTRRRSPALKTRCRAEQLGEVTLKGISHPVAAFNVTGFK